LKQGKKNLDNLLKTIMLTLKKLNEFIDFHNLDLKASKPSLLSPFVLHPKNSNAWNNRVFEGRTLREVKAFIDGFISKKD
jgi:hypothetical protein